MNDVPTLMDGGYRPGVALELVDLNPLAFVDQGMPGRDNAPLTVFTDYSQGDREG